MPALVVATVYGPNNIVQAVAAATHLNRTEPSLPPPRVVLYNPVLNDDTRRQALKMLGIFCRSQEWPEPLSLTTPEHFQGLSHVLYAHDLVGDFHSRLFAAHPGARRIVYGDGMGQVYDRGFLERVAPPASRTWGQRLRDWTLRRGSSPREFSPHGAFLTLPVDDTRRGFPPQRLTIIPGDVARMVIDKALALMPEIPLECKRLAGQTAPPRFLLTLSNLEEAGFCDAGRETDFYVRLVSACCRRGATILIKPHPLGQTSATADLPRALREEGFDPHILSDPLQRMPMELLPDLLAQTTVLSFSSTALSAKFLHGNPVAYGLDENLIEQCIRPQHRALFRHIDSIQRAQLNALDAWDGTGFLWSSANQRTRINAFLKR